MLSDVKLIMHVLLKHERWENVESSPPPPTVFIAFYFSVYFDIRIFKKRQLFSRFFNYFFCILASSVGVYFKRVGSAVCSFFIEIYSGSWKSSDGF